MGMETASHEMSTFSKRKDLECMLSDSQKSKMYQVHKLKVSGLVERELLMGNFLMY
ncbi:hypothetical protein T11_17984 [Trichinella zimbabwensis]|uniref:Uncharacterized protein n=1 Tax=Trichinella zimbabwensis TaxID=268475 RepID=A0A0V1GB79_9BILA|nr:hypothetical protein T11_17984 [Trichinella zimbabwensis]